MLSSESQKYVGNTVTIVRNPYSKHRPLLFPHQDDRPLSSASRRRSSRFGVLLVFVVFFVNRTRYYNTFFATTLTLTIIITKTTLVCEIIISGDKILRIAPTTTTISFAGTITTTKLRSCSFSDTRTFAPTTWDARHSVMFYCCAVLNYSFWTQADRIVWHESTVHVSVVVVNV